MITKVQFEVLSSALNEYVVSIYIPTYRVGNQQEDKIRLKNAIKKAHEKLIFRYELTEHEADEFLTPATELMEESEFWNNQSDGLAIFLAEDRFEYYNVPVDFEPMIYVAPEFYLRPLLPVLGETTQFYFLALSKGDVKLYIGNEYSIAAVNVNDLVPANMDAALLKDGSSGSLSRAGSAEGQGGGNSPVYFSRGGDPSHDVEDVKTYLDRVDKGITHHLAGSNVPLLLGGVEELTAIYHEANTYTHLYEEASVHGNLENETIAMIHEKAWSVAAPHFHLQQERDHELYGENLAAGEAGAEITTIIPAAINGRIAVIWLDRKTYAYGTYEQAKNDVKIMTDEDKNATELYNLAAVSAFSTGARVYNVDADQLPAGTTGMCAIYRYSITDQSTK